MYSPALRTLTIIGAALFFSLSFGAAREAPKNQFIVTADGAIGDGVTLNTKAIQKTIDSAASSGGTVVIPEGVFLSGALFLKPGVNLQFEQNAVLKGSPNIADYPTTKTRIEGQTTDWAPALLNADKCDHLKISGPGTLDGNGQVFYTAFWEARKADAQVTNLAVPRPRLAFIQFSNDVQISGVTFKDSGFWNLHLYRCADVIVESARFEAPYGKAPKRGASTDAIDIDSSQRVTIRGCFFAVNDDAVCLKGTKGPFALEDTISLPTEHIRISDCTFEAGHGVLSCGSEATVIRDVIVENSRVTGKVPLVRIKVRPDTAQHYEDIHFRNITISNEHGAFMDAIFDFVPWTQFFDLKGQQPPKSVVKNITLTDIRGNFGSLGEIRGTPGQTEITGITLRNIDLQLKNETFKVTGVKDLKLENVSVNGKDYR